MRLRLIFCMRTARSPVEADAEAIRAAILLDEMDTRLTGGSTKPGRTGQGGQAAGPPRAGRIIVEVTLAKYNV